MVDGERMLRHLCDTGMVHTDDPSEADVILVNTCTFIREATQEAINTILEMAELKRRGKCTCLAVAGCFSERYRRSASTDLPEVDVWIDVPNRHEQIARIWGAPPRADNPRYLTEDSATRYLKIADGCSHRCSFCVIPALRGPFLSRSPDDIVSEARWLRENGTKECILVAQDTSRYGRDRGGNLVQLLERILRDVPFEWIRLMYLHPRNVDDALLRLVAGEPRLCSYFDIPLQHIADPILRAMGRRPHAAGTRKLLERIRTLVPDSALRTTFILGFPGETSRQFDTLVRFVEQQCFDKVGVFPYSPEEGTPAASMRGRPRDATVMRRCEELMEVQREISSRRLASRVNELVPVIIDRESDEPGFAAEARTQWDAPEVDGRVWIAGGSPAPGAIVTVRIVESSDYDLYAEYGGKQAI